LLFLKPSYNLNIVGLRTLNDLVLNDLGKEFWCQSLAIYSVWLLVIGFTMQLGFPSEIPLGLIISDLLVCLDIASSSSNK